MEALHGEVVSEQFMGKYALLSMFLAGSEEHQ